MAFKKSSKRKVWKCPYCKVTNPNSPIPCKHLNKLISESPAKTEGPAFESTYKRTVKVLENISDDCSGFVPKSLAKGSAYEATFRKKFDKTKLTLLQVDILVLRFVYDLSIRDISDELSFISPSQVFNIYNEAILILRKIA